MTRMLPSAVFRLFGFSKRRRQATEALRRAAQKRRRRQHLIQTLERRDHPGSMLEASMLALLGKPEGQSDDPVDQMLDSADVMRQRREAYQRLTSYKSNQASKTFRRGALDASALEQSHQNRSDAFADQQNQDRSARRSIHNRLLDLLRQRGDRPASNPLLDSISQSDVFSGLDESLSSPAAGGTGQQEVGPGATSPNGSGSSGGSASGRLQSPVSQAADQSGAAMSPSQPPTDGGSSGGGGGGAAGEDGSSATAGGGTLADPTAPVTQQGDSSSDTNSDSDNVAADPTPPAPSAEQDGLAPAEPDDQPSTEPVVVRAKAEVVLAAAPSKDGLAVTAAAATDGRGEGRFVLHADLGQDWSSGQIVDAIAVRDGVARTLGTLQLDTQVQTGRLVGTGRLSPGDQVILHRHDGDGLLGDVSGRYDITPSVDLDSDGVDQTLEGLLADGNADGIVDAVQSSVATLPDAIHGKPATIDARGVTLSAVRNAEPQEDRSHHQLPLGLFGFQLHDVPIGGIRAVDVYLPDDEPVEGWFKEDPTTGRLSEFFFDGDTGAIQTDFGYTLYLQDGGRGDEDGIANGVIVDPGGPGFAGSLTITDDRNLSTLGENGGSSPASAGRYEQITYQDRNFEAIIEGDSLLTTLTRSIVVPENPSWLIFGFEAGFDPDSQGRINDAFEVALLDADGFSVVPTYQNGRDSYFNLTEQAQSTGSGADKRWEVAQSLPDPSNDQSPPVVFTPTGQSTDAHYRSGYVDLDISNLIAGQEVTLVMRLVNNDGDTRSWFRLTNDRPVPVAEGEVFTIDVDSILQPGAFDYRSLTDNDRDGDLQAEHDLEVVVDSVTQPAGGTVTVQPDGSFTYTPDPGYFNTGPGQSGDSSDDDYDTFTYHISNGLFSSEVPATVRVHVVRQSAPPVAVDDVFGAVDGNAPPVDEDMPVVLDVLDNDSDPDGDRLTVTHVGGTPIDPQTPVQIDNAEIRLGQDGRLTITPEPNYSGPIEFSYVINDGTSSATAVVRGRFEPLNDPPAAADDSLVVPQNGTAAGNVITAAATIGGLAASTGGPDADPDGDSIAVVAVNGASSSVGQTISGSGGGQFTLMAGGTFEFDPRGDFDDLADGQTAQTSVTYTIADAGNARDTATLAITVTGQNDAPVLTAEVPDQTGTDAGAALLDVSAFFSEIDLGDSLTFAATGLPADLTLSTAGIISGTWSRDASQNAPYRITIAATDGSGQTAQDTFDWDVSNPKPVARDNARDTTAAESIAGNVLVDDDGAGVDSDADGDPLSVVAAGGSAGNVGLSVPGSAGGRFVIADDGTYTFDPGNEFVSLALGDIIATSLSYTIDDGGVGDIQTQQTAVLSVTVTGLNEPPVAGGQLADRANVDGQTISPVDTASAFSDVDGDSLTFTADNLPPGLSIVPATGVISGTLPSDASAVATRTVTITATDTSGESASASFDWTVINPSPIATDDNVSTDENISVSGTVIASGSNGPDVDPDGDDLRIVEVNEMASQVGQDVLGTSGGVFRLSGDLNAGSFTFDPAGDFDFLSDGQSATTSITYTISDAQGARSSATLSVFVAGRGDQPVATSLPDQFNVDAQTIDAVDFSAAFSDVDADDSLTYTVATPLPGGLTLDPTTGVVTGTLDSDASVGSPYDIMVIATDTAGLSASATMRWTVTNPAPVAAADAVQTHPSQSVTGFWLANDIDPDGDALTLVQVAGDVDAVGASVPGDGGGRFVVSADGRYTFDPGDDFDDLTDGQTRSATITYTIDDHQGGRSTATITATVTGINSPPRAIDDAYSTLEDTPLTVPAAGVMSNDSDPDGDPLSAVVVQDVSHGTLTLGPDGSFNYVPEADFFGTDQFTYRVSDAEGSDTATVTIIVDPVSDPMLARDDAYQTAEDTVLVIDAPGVLVNDTERDGDPVTVVLEGPTEFGGIKLSGDGSLVYTPSLNFGGVDTFTYRMFDGTEYSNVATVTLTVESQNDAPVAVEDGYVTDAGVPLVIDAVSGMLNNDSDPDGDAITVATVSDVSPTGAGTFNHAADGSFTFTPAAGFDGTVTLSYTVSDGLLTSDPATVTILVTAPEEFAKFYIPDHNSHQVFSYDDGGGFNDRFDYQRSDRARGITANEAGDTLWTVTAGHDVLVYTPEGQQIGKWQARVNERRGKKVRTTNLHKAEGVATDGTDVWIVDEAKNRMLHYAGGASHRSGNHTATDTFDLHSSNRSARGLTTDGTNLYVLDQHSHQIRVFVYNLSGEHLGNWQMDVGPGTHRVEGITTNPTGTDELWVVDRHTDRVYYFPTGTRHRGGQHASVDTFVLHADNDHAYGIADPPPAGVTPTLTWTGASNDDWNFVGNWATADNSPARVPTVNDIVSLPPGSDVAVSANAQVGQVFSDGMFRLTSGTLTIDGDSEFQDLQVTGGLIEGSGDIAITAGGSLEFLGGQIDGSGTLTIPAGATGQIGDRRVPYNYDQNGNGINSPEDDFYFQATTKILDRTLINEGDLTWAGTGTLRLDDEYFRNDYNAWSQDDDGLVPIVLDNRGSFTITSSGLIDEYHNARISSTNQFDETGRPVIRNSGTLQIDVAANGNDQTVQIEANVDNTGTVNVLGGTVELDGGGNSSGTFSVSADATLQFDPSGNEGVGDSVLNIAGSTIAGAGTVVFSRGYSQNDGDVTAESLKVTGGTVVFEGLVDVTTLEVTGGTARFNSDVTVDHLIVTGGRIEGSGDIAITPGGSLEFLGGQIDGSGTLTIPAGASGQIGDRRVPYNYDQNGNGINSPEDDFYFQQTTKILDRTLINEGDLTWAGTGTLQLDDEYFRNDYNAWSQDDDGLVPIVLDNRGSFTITSSGLIDEYHNARISSTNQFDETGRPVIRNSGTLQIDVAANGSDQTVQIEANVENTGTFRVLGGTVLLNGGGSSSGAFEVSAGQTLQFNLASFSSGNPAAALNLTDSQLSGGGTVSLIGGEVIFGGPVDVQTLQVIGGTARIQTDVEVNNLIVTGGVIEGPGDLTVAAGRSFDWTGGQIDGSGTLTIPAGATGQIGDRRVPYNYDQNGNGINSPEDDFYFQATTKILDRTLINEGDLTWAGTGTLRLDDEYFRNDYNAWSQDDDGLVPIVLDNRGRFTITSSGLIDEYHNARIGSTNQFDETGRPVIRNSGTLQIDVAANGNDQTVQIEANVDNTGTVNVLGGTVELDGGGNSSGTFSVSADATLQFDPSGNEGVGDSVLNIAGSTIAGAGTVVFSRGYSQNDGDVTAESLKVTGGTVVFEGLVDVTTLEVTGGTARFNSDVTVDHLIVTGGRIEGSGDIAITPGGSLEFLGGQIDGSGTLTIPAGASGQIGDRRVPYNYDQNGNGINSPEDDFYFQQTTKILDRTLINEGDLTWAGTGTLQLDDEYFRNDYNAWSQDDDGLVPIVLDNRGSFTITSSGLIDEYHNARISSTNQFDETGRPVIRNSGTLQIDVAANGSDQTVQIEANVENTGTFRVLGGTAQLDQRITQTATIEVESDATLWVGSSSSAASRNYEQTSGTTAIRGGTLRAGGEIRIKGGTFQAQGTLIGDVINQSNLTIGWPTGELRVEGDYSQTATASLSVDATSDGGLALDRLIVDGTVQLDGTFDYDFTGLTSIPGRLGFVENDGTDAIVGQFTNVAEGDTVPIDGTEQPFSYFGGTGNDFAFGPRPTVWLADSTLEVLESQQADIAVRISEPYTDVLTIEYVLDGGTTDANDLGQSLGTGTIQIQPGETESVIQILTSRDDDTASETFAVTLTPPAFADLASPERVDVTIVDTTDREILVSDVNVLEGGMAEFVVTLSQPRDVTVTVDYATEADGTGAGAFTAVSGTLTFAPGETAKTVTVQTVQDIISVDDTFNLLLSNPTENYIRDGQGVASMLVRGDTPDDPGDSIVNAYLLPLTPNQLTRVDQEIIGDGIYRNWDVDLYRVDVEAGQTLYATAIATSLDEAALRVFDAAGSEVVTTTVGSHVAYTATTTDTYYLGVSGFGNVNYDATVENSGSDGFTTGAYSLRVAAVDGDQLPDIEVYRDAGQEAALSTEGEPLDFGDLLLGEVSRQAVYVRNGGDGPLDVIDIITPSGVEPAGNFRGLLGPGQTRTVVLELSGQSVGSFVEAVQIITNDPDQGAYSFDVTASVKPPLLDALDDTITGVAPGVATTLDVLANDLGNDLTILAASSHGGGSVSISSDGSSLEFVGESDLTTTTLTYQITDGTTFDTATVTVQANLSPLANDDRYANVEAGETLTLFPLDNDRDPDGDAMTIVEISGLTGATFDGDQINYTVPADFVGQTFNYTVADSAGNRSTAQVELLPPGNPQWTFDIDFNRLVDVTDSVRFDYQVTSFHDQQDTLYAELSLENVGTYDVRGPILLGVKNLDNPAVQVVGPDGFAPDGMPYFNITDSVVTEQSPFFEIGDRFGTTLAFETADRTPFNYELVVLGFLNEAPRFTTTAVTEALPGTVYQYNSDAVDPDNDRVTYEKVVGPETLTVVESSGVIVWPTDTDDTGNHPVSIRATDQFGATALHTFAIDVNASANRPPRFTSTPVEVAVAGEPYQYQLAATDPDLDDVTFTRIEGPEGLVIQDGDRGLVTWTPPVELIGRTVEVTARADDGRGGSAIHRFNIAVVQDSLNRPPIIITEPETQLVLPVGFDNPPTGNVTPGGIALSLEEGETSSGSVSITLPADSVGVSAVDVFLLFDDTGSYAGRVPQVINRFPEIIDSLRDSFSEVDFAFGVGRYEEYGGFAGEDASGRPFTLNQAIVESDTPGFQNAIDQALNREAPGYGGDGPETAIEALYQIATGVGFDGNQNGSTYDSGFAGLAATQSSPGGSGDVPSFRPYLIDPTTGGLAASGRLGGVGFREGALPVVLVATDINVAYSEPEVPQEFIYGVDGVSVPTSAFSGRNTTPPGGAEIQETVDALSDLGALVIGIDGPRSWLEAIATLTGAVNNTDETIDGGSNSIAPGDPLYFTGLSGDLSNGIGSAIEAAITTALYNVNVVSTRPDIAVNLTGTQFNREGETAIEFEVQYTGDGSGSAFDLQFVNDVGNIVYGSVPVTIQRPYRYDLDAIDPDFDAISYRLIGETHGAEIDPQDGVFRWAPGAPGEYTFTAEAADGRGGIDIQTWTVSVVQPSDLNAPPEFQSIEAVSLLTGLDGRWTVSAEDPDGDSVRYALTDTIDGASALPEGLSIDPFSGAISWNPGEDQIGSYLIGVSASDGRGGATTTTFTLEVAQPEGVVNGKPVFTSVAPDQAFVGGTYRYDVRAVDPENELVIYDLVFAPSGVSIDPATGRIGWNPAADQTGPQTIYVRATDPRGGFDLQVFDVDVTDLNAAPVITSTPTAPGGLGTAWTYPVLANDPNGDTLLYEIDSASLDRGMQINASTGVLTWTPNTAGTFTTIVRVSDPAGKDDFQSFTLTIDSNTPPRITSQPNGTLYVGELFTYDVAATDDDGDSVTLRLDAASIDRGIRLVGETLRWTPMRTGEFTAILTADDGRGGTSTQTLTLPVFARSVDSEPPRITSEPAGPVYAATPWTYVVQATDPDGSDDELVYQLVDDGSADRPLATGETVSFDPDTGTLTWSTPEPSGRTFTVGVTDQAGVQSTQTFTATASVARQGQTPRITSVPQGPAIVGRPYAYQVVAFDPDGDPLRYLLDGPAGGATIDPITGQLSVTPTNTTAIELTIRVRDVDANDQTLDGSVTQSFTLPVVRAPGSLPQITSTPVGPAVVGQTWTYRPSAIDPDGDAVTIDWDTNGSSTGNETVTYNATTSQVEWTPTVAGAEVTLRVTATDRDGETSQTFTIAAVAPVVNPAGNDAPVFTTTPRGPVRAGQRWSYFAAATDADGDAVTYRVDDASTDRGVTIDPTSGRLNWTPQGPGDFPVSVIADDGRGGVATQSFTVSVSIVNVPPAITSTPTGPAVLGRTWTYTLAGTDANDEDASLQRQLVTPVAGDLPAGMTWDPATGIVTWRPESLDPVDFEFRLTDPQQATATQTFTLQVAAPVGPANRSPLIRSVPTSPAVLGQTYAYPIDAIDLDGDTVTLRVSSTQLGLAEQLINESKLTFVPTSLDPVDFVVTADDGRGGVTTQRFTVEIAEPAATNRPPRISTSPVGPATVGQTWTYTPAGTDPDGDTVVFSFQNDSTDAGASDVSLVDGTLVWTPRAVGLTLTGTLSATDGRGGTATQTFSLLSVAVPDGGEGNAVPRFVTTPEAGAVAGRTWTYNARAVDDDGDVVSYSLDQSSRTAGFSVDRNTGVVSWQPAAPGDVTFTLLADDGRGGVGRQVITVPVATVNATPRITSRPTGPAIVGNAWSYTVVAVDADDAPADLSYSLVSATDPAGVRFDAATATLTWTPTAESELGNTFVVRVADVAGAAAEQTFTVAAVATPAGRPPTFRSVPVTEVPLGQTYRYAARATDPDGDALTYSLVSAPAGMSIDPATGLVSWRAAAIGTADVVIAASDGVFSPTTQRFTLTVTPPRNLNAPPTITSTPSGPAIRGNQWTYAAAATDPDGDPVRWRIGNVADFPADNQPSIDPVTGAVSWTPAAEGRYELLVEASDRDFAPGTATDGQRFTLTVSGNLPPRWISSPTLQVTAGAAYVYDAVAIDPNRGDALTYTLDADSIARGMTLAADGTLRWPAADTAAGGVGRYPVTLRVSDPAGLFDEQAFAFVVLAGDTGAGQNTPPTITRSPAGQIVQDREFTFAFEAVDPDADAVTFQSDDLPTGAILTPAGVLTWTPAAGQTGEQSFTVQATDGAAASDPVTVTLTVLPAGQDAAPVFVTDPVRTVTAGQPYVYDSRAVDAGGQTVTYFLDDAATALGLAVDGSTGQVTWDTADVPPGRYPVTLTASDAATIDAGLTDTQTFVVEVTSASINADPAFTSPPRTAALAGGLYRYQAAANDPDGDDLTFGLLTGPDGLVVDPVSGLVQWIPTTDQVGSHEARLVVVDGQGGRDVQTFDVDVAGANRPPRVDSSPSPAAYLGETYRYDVVASDPDGHSLTYSLDASTTAGGDIDLDPITGRLTWNPAATGDFRVQVNVVDELGLGVGHVFGVRVAASRPNNAPRFDADTAPPFSVSRSSTDAASVYTYDFGATDPDGDPVTFAFGARSPAGGRNHAQRRGDLDGASRSAGRHPGGLGHRRDRRAPGHRDAPQCHLQLHRPDPTGELRPDDRADRRSTDRRRQRPADRRWGPGPERWGRDHLLDQRQRDRGGVVDRRLWPDHLEH